MRASGGGIFEGVIDWRIIQVVQRPGPWDSRHTLLSFISKELSIIELIIHSELLYPSKVEQ
jgi:hypothetical protein